MGEPERGTPEWYVWCANNWVRLRAMRHFFASWAIEQGAEAAEWDAPLDGADEEAEAC